MQKKGTFEVLFTFFILSIFLIFLIITITQYDRQTRMFPLVVSVPALILCIVLLASYFIPQINDKISTLKQKEFFKEYDKEEEKSEILEDKKRLVKELNISLWIIAVLIAIYLFGFVTIIPLFIFLFLKFREKESIFISIMISISSWIVIYIVFIKLLKVQLYKGLFF